jgi:flagellar basal body-associated protein FliL
MVNQQNNQNNSKEIKQQQPKLKRSRFITVMMLPFVLVSSFFGLIFFWIDNRRHMTTKRSRSQDENIHFSMASLEEYAK